MILLIIHVYEEYLTDFEVAVTDIFGFHVQEQTFLTIIELRRRFYFMLKLSGALKRLEACGRERLVPFQCLRIIHLW